MALVADGRMSRVRSWLWRGGTERWVNVLQSICTSHCFGALLSVFVLGVGILGSVYVGQIQPEMEVAFSAMWSWWQGEPPPQLTFTKYSYAFASALGVFFVFFWSRQWAMARSTRHATKDFVKRAEQFERAARTFPPDSFLPSFSRYYYLAFKAFIVVSQDENKTPELFDRAIREILWCFLATAMAFDERNAHDGKEPSVYGANIMRFKSISELDSGDRDVVRFVGPAGLNESYLGILRIQRNWSCIHLSGESADPNLPDFAIPVPAQEKGPTMKTRVLPGAPAALHAQHGVHSFHDTHEMADWCAKYGNFDDYVIDEIRSFFHGEEGKRVRSFASFTLRVSGAEFDTVASEASSNLGVINIHRDLAAVLEDRGRIQNFVPFASPFRTMLAELVASYPDEGVNGGAGSDGRRI